MAKTHILSFMTPTLFARNLKGLRYLLLAKWVGAIEDKMCVFKIPFLRVFKEKIFWCFELKGGWKRGPGWKAWLLITIFDISFSFLFFLDWMGKGEKNNQSRGQKSCLSCIKHIYYIFYDPYISLKIRKMGRCILIKVALSNLD